MNHIRDVETMRFTTELQTFDRKSARIDVKALIFQWLLRIIWMREDSFKIHVSDIITENTL